MACFFFKNDIFEINGTLKEICTFLGVYFSNESETNFIESQQNEPFTWFIYIDNIFFVRIHWEDKLKTFLGDLNKF